MRNVRGGAREPSLGNRGAVTKQQGKPRPPANQSVMPSCSPRVSTGCELTGTRLPRAQSLQHPPPPLRPANQKGEECAFCAYDRCPHYKASSPHPHSSGPALEQRGSGPLSQRGTGHFPPCTWAGDLHRPPLRSRRPAEGESSKKSTRS